MVTESESPLSRSALLAGSSGLIGRALLPLLLASPRYAQVHALLRRPVPELRADRKLQFQVVDFQALPDLPQVDDVFIALGTTIKVAGSRSAFRQVDFDAVLNTARAARTAGATRLAVISLGRSLGTRPTGTCRRSLGRPADGLAAQERETHRCGPGGRRDASCPGQPTARGAVAALGRAVLTDRRNLSPGVSQSGLKDLAACRLSR